MAKLEFYRQQVIPRIATADARGLAGIGAQAVKTAEAVTEGIVAAARIKSDIDKLRVEDTFNKLRERQTDLMMNPETGFANKRAADAVTPDFISRYRSDFDKSIDELANSLPGNQAQEMFRRRAQMAKAEFEDNLMRHVSRETRQYGENVYKGAIATELQNASMNYSDPAKLNDSIGRITYNTSVMADREGITGDALMALQRDNLAKLHSTVVQAALDKGDYEYARTYFDTNKSQMDAATASTVEKAVKDGGVRDESLKLALQLSSSGMGFDAQRKQLKDMYSKDKISAEVYDQTMQRISSEAQLAKANEADYNNAMSGRAQEWILQNPGKSIADMPPNIYRWAKSKGQLDTLSRFASTAGKPDGDPAEFTRIFTLSADNPIGFVKEFDATSNELRLKMSPGQYGTLLTTRNSIVSGDLKGQQAAKIAAGTIRSIRNNLISSGIDVTPKEGSKQAETLANFESQLIQAIDVKTQEVGRALTLDESRKIGLELLKEGRLIDAGWFGDKSIRRFEVTPEQRAEYLFIGYEYGEIPQADRQRLENVIKARADLQKQLGVKRFNDGSTSRPSVQRAVELLYQAELDGVRY